MSEVIDNHEGLEQESSFASLSEMPAFNLQKAQENVDKAKAALSPSGETPAVEEEKRTSESIYSELATFAQNVRIADLDEFLESGNLAPGDSQEDADKMYSLMDELAASVKTDLENGTPITKLGDMMLNPNGRYDDMQIGEITYHDFEKFDDFIHSISYNLYSPDPILDDRIISTEDMTAPDVRHLPYCLEDVEKYTSAAKANARLDDDVVAKRKITADITFSCAERAITALELDSVRSGILKLWTEQLPESQLTGSLPVATVAAQKFSNYVSECYDQKATYANAEVMTCPTVRKMIEVADESHTYEQPSAEAMQYFGDLVANEAQYGSSEKIKNVADKISWLASTQNYKPLGGAIQPYDVSVFQRELAERGVLATEDFHQLWQYRFKTFESEGRGFSFSNVDLLPVEDRHAARIFHEHSQYFYEKTQENSTKPAGERLKIFAEDGMPSAEFVDQAIVEAAAAEKYNSRLSNIRSMLLNNPDLIAGHEKTIWESSIGGALDGDMTDQQKIFAKAYYSRRINPDTMDLSLDVRDFLLSKKSADGPARYEDYSDDDIDVPFQVFDIIKTCNIGSSQECADMAREILDGDRQNAVAYAEKLSALKDRIFNSNSTQLSHLAPEIARQLFSSPETADEKITRLEHIFLRKNIPDFAKLYCCANVLFEKNIDSEQNISPVLKSAEDKRSVLMTDLLKTSIRSNNRSLRDYLENIQSAEGLAPDEELSEGESEILSDFENGKKFRTRFFGFARNLNLENAGQILAEMDRCRSERDAMHRDSVVQENGTFRLRRGIENGDFIKGINSQYIHTMMRDGFNCPEMVGSGATQDVTHWDTDCGSANDLESDPTLAGAISRSIASGYGDGLYVVMHNDERFSHTSPDDASGYVGGTYEAYHGTANGETFRGIRTGFGSEDVDFFVSRDKDAKNVWMLKQEIAKTGCYVPIVDRDSEEVIFTPAEFDELRLMMSGTEHYGAELKEFKFADNLELPDSLEGDLHFSELVADYDKKESETRAMQTMLTAHLLVAIEQSDLPAEVKDAFRNYNQNVSRDATSGTVDAISTGSTGRFTNKPHDADFDFIWRIDNAMLQKYGGKITRALTEGHINGAPVINGYGDGGGDIGKGLRKGLVDININGNPVRVEVDITPVIKTDRLEFSSEQALAERLAQIRSQDEEKYKQVIANIVIAKQVLKQNGVYKKTGEHGIGGIGVENWILQHGGSLRSAAEGFLAHARNEDGGYKDLAGLRSSYAIFDLGENHMSRNYPYDNFLDNLTGDDSGSYQKMIKACEEIVGESPEVRNEI